MALCNYQGPLAAGPNFVKNSLTYFNSLFISSSTLHLIAERLARVTADTSFKVFGIKIGFSTSTTSALEIAQELDVGPVFLNQEVKREFK